MKKELTNEESIEQYEKQHKFCPKCGSISCSTISFNYYMDILDNNYKDKEACICYHCLYEHIVHDRISLEEARMLIQNRNEKLKNKQYTVPDEKLKGLFNDACTLLNFFVSNVEINSLHVRITAKYFRRFLKLVETLKNDNK